MNQVWLTDKINKQLAETAKVNKVTKEALCNILLVLSLSNESSVAQAVKLINLWGLGGATKLENLTL